MDPMTWLYIIMLVVSLVVSIAMRPKPQNAKPPELADFEAPSVDEGREMAWVHGEDWIEDPNVLWWGDLRTTPIRASGGK